MGCNHFMLKKTWHKFVVFSFVGGIAFLIDWTSFNIIYYLSSWFIFSLAFAWIISMVFNFTTNRNFTFSATENPIKIQLPKWLIVQASAFLTRTFVGKSILFFLDENLFTANIAFFCGIMVAIPISFLGSNNWAFKKNYPPTSKI